MTSNPLVISGTVATLLLFLATASKTVPAAWTFIVACARVPLALEKIAQTPTVLEALDLKVDLAAELAAKAKDAAAAADKRVVAHSQRTDIRFDALDKQVAGIEYQLHPNSGTSLRDDITFARTGLEALRTDVTGLSKSQVELNSLVNAFLSGAAMGEEKAADQ